MKNYQKTHSLFLKNLQLLLLTLLLLFFTTKHQDMDVVVALAQGIGDQALEAEQYKNMGVVLKSRAKACEEGGKEKNERLNVALKNYQRASEVQTRLGEHQENVKSLRGIAGVLQMQGMLDLAVEACKESIKLARVCSYKAGISRAQRVQVSVVLVFFILF